MNNLKNKFNRFSKTMKNLPGYASAKIRGKPFHWTMSNAEAKAREYNFQKADEIRGYYKNQGVSRHPELKPENVENLRNLNEVELRGIMSNTEAKKKQRTMKAVGAVRRLERMGMSVLPGQRQLLPELIPGNVENLEEVNVEKVMEKVRKYPGNVPLPRASFNENILPSRTQKQEFVPVGVNLASASPYTSGEMRENIRRNIRNRKPVTKAELQELLEAGSQNDFMLVAQYLKNISRKKGGKSRKTRKQRKH